MTRYDVALGRKPRKVIEPDVAKPPKVSLSIDVDHHSLNIDVKLRVSEMTVFNRFNYGSHYFKDPIHRAAMEAFDKIKVEIARQIVAQLKPICEKHYAGATITLDSNALIAPTTTASTDGLYYHPYYVNMDITNE